jgi:sensor histidine kinase YesM
MSRHVVITIACALLAVIQSMNVYAIQQASPQSRGFGTLRFALALMLPTWIVMAACVPLIARLARTYTFVPQNRARSAMIHVAAASVFALLHIVAVAANRILLLPSREPLFDQFAFHFRNSLTYLFYQDVLAYGALLALYLALYYADLRAQLVNARLSALRAQLNPHFFFNTLNAVSTLALQGRRDDVAEIVGRLGDLLRTALEEKAQEVSLSAELAFADDYLAIQRIRFGDRFQVDKRISAEALVAAVPSLLLQPILENAVEHAVAREEGVTFVKIDVSRCGNDLFVEVSDTGPGFAHGARKEGIGLSNTRARIQELYGHLGRFEYGNLPGGGASVRISIPFHYAGETATDARANHEYALRENRA